MTTNSISGVITLAVLVAVLAAALSGCSSAASASAAAELADAGMNEGAGVADAISSQSDTDSNSEDGTLGAGKLDDFDTHALSDSTRPTCAPPTLKLQGLYEDVAVIYTFPGGIGWGYGVHTLYVTHDGVPGTLERVELLGTKPETGGLSVVIGIGLPEKHFTLVAGNTELADFATVTADNPVSYSFSEHCSEACIGDYVLRWHARSSCGAVQFYDIYFKVLQPGEEP